MYLEVSKESWDLYVNWFSREIGNIEYQEYEDGSTDVIDVCYSAIEIGFMTIEYENDQPVKKYMIQIENQYFQRFCKGK